MNRTRTQWPSERLLQWTPRQRQVLELIARGRTNAEIAELLGVSLGGAKWHVSEVLTKLNAGSREEAAEYWRARSRLGPRLRRMAGGLGVPLGWKALATGGGVAVLSAGGLAGGILIAGAATGGEAPASFQAEASPTPMPDGRVTWDIRDLASPFQEEILADGLVTEDEYLRAVDATIACVQNKGYRVNVVAGRDASRAIHWTAHLDPNPPATVPALAAGWGDDPPPGYMQGPLEAPSWCEFQYMHVVQIYWYHQNRPTPEYKKAVRAYLLECLAEKDYDVSSAVDEPGVPVGAPEVSELIRFGEGRRAFNECVARTRRVWGLALYGNTSYHVSGVDDPGTAENEAIERLPDVLPAVR